jgi:glycosyltransferase involved in cell wall biosynthesis
LIVSDVRGCREVVEDEVNGILVPKRDPRSLANAIDRLVSDRTLREKMGEAGRDKAIREFDERDVVARVMSAYDQVALRKGLAP